MSHLEWTPTQVQVYNLLKQRVSFSDTAKQAGVSKPYITKINHAIKMGQSPEIPNTPHHEKPILSDEPGPGNSGGVKTGDDSKTVNTKPTSVDASLLLLKPIPQTCALTPIMINARYAAITRLGWPDNVTWEDFFDTCLVHLFRYWGYGLQGIYELEGNEKDNSPKPASEKPWGNGHKFPPEKAQQLGEFILDIIAESAAKTPAG